MGRSVAWIAVESTLLPAAGGVDFLYKPIEPRVLMNKTETFFKL